MTSWWTLATAFGRLAERLNLEGSGSVFDSIRNRPRGAVYGEAILHELCHTRLLRVTSSESVDHRIRTMQPRAADRHEARTCAIELNVVRALGLCGPGLSALAAYAANAMSMFEYPEARRVIQTLLSAPGVKRHARQIVRLIKEEAARDI